MTALVRLPFFGFHSKFHGSTEPVSQRFQQRCKRADRRKDNSGGIGVGSS